MKIVDGLEALDALDLPARYGERALETRSAVIVGVFDGVHLGHQRLLHELGELASALSALPTVVTFRNHPDAFLRGREVEWIVSLPHRLRLLRRAGVGRTVLLDFDARIRDMSARAFSERILLDGLGCRGLLLGYDSAIGKHREGTPERMTELGEELGFEVRQGTRFEVDGQPVSSTAIRNAVTAGDLDAAYRMLGRWPASFGPVIHGDRRGRALGFPTANVVPQSLCLPPEGVYAVLVIQDGLPLHGVANLGRRPTFPGAGDRPVLEVHLLDFAGDLYGQDLEVGFVTRLRDERRFTDADDLRAQIRADVAAARRALDD